MTIPTNTFTTFDAIGNREDLTDMIYMISPTDTPLISSIGTSTATATFHEWQTVSLAAVDTSNAQVQGDDAAAVAATATARVGNRTQISSKTVIVSGTQDAVNKAGRAKELAYQTTLKGLELRRDMEAIMTRNQTSVTGNTTTAPKLGSLEAWISTNTNRGATGASHGFSGGTITAAGDGTQRAFTELLLKDVILQTYASGGNPDTIMVGPFNKQVMSTFTGNATKTKDIADKKLIAAIDVYVSDFGTMKVVPNRFQRDRTAFVLETDKLAVAYLPGRSFVMTDLARTGDAAKKQMLSEYTLEVRNQAAIGVVADLTTS